MQTLVLKSDSEVDLNLIAQIAKKMGIQVKVLTDEEKEDIGMFHAIKIGKTGQYVDNDNFIKNLRK